MTVELNPYLIEQQGLDEIDVLTVEALHAERERLFETIERDVDMLSIETCVDLGLNVTWVNQLEDIEFALQRAWGFDEKRAKHTWWFMIPHCTCPKSDNLDISTDGLPIRLKTTTCPIHGNIEF